MSEEKKIIIIGGGIAGLSAGCYLQMSGYRTEVFEAGRTPGGLCTGWKRGPYTFEGCLHWLVGTGTSDPFHAVWRELGALADTAVVDYEEFMRVEGSGGRCISVFADIDKLGDEMVKFAPEDRGAVEELTEAVKKLARLKLPIDKPPELMNPLERLRVLFAMVPFYPEFRAWKKRSLREYALSFKNPLLREVIVPIVGDERVSALILVMMLAWFSRKAAGYPLGGSLGFAHAIERRYRSLGGSIRYGSRVISIVTRGGEATGVRMEDGTVHEADTVVSAADGHTTIFKMLDGKYVDRAIVDDYNTLPLFPSLLQVSLGVADAFPQAPPALSFPLNRPLLIDGRTRVDRLTVRIFNFDPSLCERHGTTVMTVLVPGAHEYWVNLRNNNPRRYRAEKERIAKEIIGILDNRFEGLAAKVEVSDVATPATYIRYTGNWKGSYEGWLPTPVVFGKSMKKTLPGLKNLYLAGQWIAPGGGLPAVALSGRHVARLICDRDRRPFRTVADSSPHS